MNPVVLVGSGSQARYVIDTLHGDRTAEVTGILDVESADNVGRSLSGVPIVGLVEDIEQHFEPGAVDVVVAYGDNRRKRELVERLSARGFGFATAVSTRAYVSTTATVAEGAIVNPLATVLPDARIGAHAVVHSGATIEHDCVIEPYANVAPGVSMGGRVTVGEGAYLYTGANVIPGRSIGAYATVGAGATVIEDVPAGATVAGVPARVIARTESLA